MFENKKYEWNNKLDNILFKIRRVRDNNPIKSDFIMGFLFLINTFLLFSNFLVGILTTALFFLSSSLLKGHRPFKENLDLNDYLIKNMAYSKYKNEENILFQFKALKEETDLGIVKEHYRIISQIVRKNKSMINNIESNSHIKKKYKNNLPAYLADYYYKLVNNREKYHSNMILLEELLMDLELRLLALNKKSESLKCKKEIKEKSLKIIEEKKKKMLKEISNLENQKTVIEEEIEELEVKQFYKENDMFKESVENYTETL